MQQLWRVGIVGAGYIADAHLLALKSVANVEVTVVCDTNASRARKLAGKWGITRVAESVEEMLRDGKPDVVHIITPPTAHVEPAVACLKARCHIFVEKPLAPTSGECRQMEDAARAAGVEAGVNHNQSWHPAVLQMKQWAAERRFGQLEHVSVCLSTGLRQLGTGQHGHWMFRKPGNILLEQAPHPLSQIVRLMGSIGEVACLPSGRRILNTGCEFWDTWQVSMVCDRGTAQMTLAFGRDHLDSWLHVSGQDAAAHADLGRNTLQIHTKRRWAPALADSIDAARNGVSLARQGWSGLAGYAGGFLKLIRPQDTFSAGMRNSIGAFYEALSEGRPVPVPISEGRAIVEACERISEAGFGHNQRTKEPADA